MEMGVLGKEFEDGDLIIKKGERGNSMFVLQQGQVEVVEETTSGEIELAVLNKGDIFGEMALFTKEVRSATVRARGKSRVLTIDKRGFFRRMHEDPSLAFRILETMARRIQDLDEQIVQLKNAAG